MRWLACLMLAGLAVWGVARAERATFGDIKTDAVAPKTKMEATGENLVRAGSFEQWEDGRPKGWTLVEVDAAGETKVRGKQSADARAGKVSLELRAPGEGKRMASRLEGGVAGLEVGQRYRFSVSVKGVGVGAVDVVLSFMEDGLPRTVRIAAVGTGEWETLEYAFEVSRKSVVESFEVMLERRAGSSGVVWVDDVQVRRLTEVEAVAVPVVVPRPKVPGHGAKP